ncbi:MAG: ABC transporter substrate-binding protein [Desulfobulbaceae bacterium]|nr:ABC transporter substrate-binding protein [Desulfobulbaceae bacterium]
MRYFFVFFIILLSCALPSGGGALGADLPQRIVSLGPLNTENVYLLGAGDRLVGNTSYCVRPEAARAKEKIGSVMQISIEKILSLQPDLVLGTGLTQPQQLKKLRELGLRVVQVKQPTSFSEICIEFLRLGRLLGLEARAKEVVRRARSEVAAVTSRVAGLPKQKVFLQVGALPLFGSVKSSFTHDYIVLGGGINVIGDQTIGTSSYEKILARNPDVIIIAIMGSESGAAAREKEKWQRFQVINAVQNNRVYTINPDLVCSPSPETFARTLAVIAGLIHPESG